MLFYIGIIILDVACLIHLVRTGRNTLWLSAIIFMPVAGALAYFVVEVLPGMRHDRHVRTARARAIQALDPKRQVRAARDALDLSDTAENRLKLADALVGLGEHAEAIPYYREAIRMTAGDPDVRTQGKLAAALYETGQGAEALALLDAADPPLGQSERDRQQLLRGKILEHLGRKDEALELYEDVVTRLPGEEARCRYAALLLDQGWDRKAIVVLEEVESRMKRLDRLQRAADADMYRWATETLARLRAAK
ncbi:tetratricopeptide repeat protein [Sphingomonas sp. LB-2]|uniref:tetratricopeptide repeat protein n=1 Tax=Sphingomonas caeni TaxID=2984949 RepID=UPI00222E5801|nr:tetratricopeptide repeat protein [Sphingomonas caeni]MCW3847745.1 tetratricopeptide repeat protein [Sphingomonas caeni]